MMRAKDGSSPACEVILYCDGACRGNPGVGGYAALLRSGGNEKVLSGAEAHTTNNRMELTAAIAGLGALTERCLVRMHTDSQYVKKGMTEWLSSWLKRGWRTKDNKPVSNRDLWEKLVTLCARHDVKWEWVAGHSGNELNERCDALANEAIDRFLAEGGDG